LKLAKDRLAIGLLTDDPAVTLRVYSHVMHEGETDPSFSDFSVPGRPYPAPTSAERLESIPLCGASLRSTWRRTTK
jgi:hypothetical protein